MMVENGIGHFRLCGEHVNITNITVRNIGSMNFFDMPFMKYAKPGSNIWQGQSSGFMRF